MIYQEDAIVKMLQELLLLLLFKHKKSNKKLKGGQI